MKGRRVSMKGPKVSMSVDEGLEVSTVLTLAPYRRRSLRRSRGIPTICVRSFSGWRANVSAVDTWLLPDPPAGPQSSRWETSSAARPV